MKKLTHSLKINMLFSAIVVLLVAALLLINGIALLLSERYGLQIDLTAGAVYEIGGGTKALLASLDAPVEIFVLSDEGGFTGSKYLMQAKRIIEQYPRFSNLVSLEFVDYTSNPAFAVNYPELPLSHGDIIVQSGGKVRHVLAANLFHYSYTQDGGLAILSSRAEEAVTSAIVNVISGEMVKIALLTGNGTSGHTLFAALLADNNYEVHMVGMTTASLEDYTAVLLCLPAIDLSEDVVRKLEAFLYNGGEYGKVLFYTAGAAQGEMPNLDRFLSEWGVKFQDGAVFETNPERTYQYQPFYPTALYGGNRYTDLLRDSSMPFLMPLSRPMELLFTSRDGYYVETLLYFSETSGVRPAGAGDDFTAANAEKRGPIPALVASSLNATGADQAHLQSHIVISASTGIFDAVALQNSSAANAEYLLNLLGGLTNREDTVNIQPKSLVGRTLGITSAQASTLGVMLVGAIPLAILLAGAAVWLLRRYK